MHLIAMAEIRSPKMDKGISPLFLGSFTQNRNRGSLDSIQTVLKIFQFFLSCSKFSRVRIQIILSNCLVLLFGKSFKSCRNNSGVIRVGSFLYPLYPVSLPFFIKSHNLKLFDAVSSSTVRPVIDFDLINFS